MAKSKSQKQVAYLLSSGSPLSSQQKEKLMSELHTGEVTIRHGVDHPSKHTHAEKKINKKHA